MLTTKHAGIPPSLKNPRYFFQPLKFPAHTNVIPIPKGTTVGTYPFIFAIA
jgi:hypothetical protein